LRLACIPQSLDCFINPAFWNGAVYAHETIATSTERIASIKAEACILDQKALNFSLGPAAVAKIYPFGSGDVQAIGVTGWKHGKCLRDRRCFTL
jgi:hypothetical protein